MTVSLLDIASQTTPANALALLLNYLTISGLPATAWQEKSVPRTLLEGESVAYADAMNLVAAIANGNILDLSEGEWLTLLAANVYQLTRKPAIFARGTATITNNSGSAFAQPAGSLLAASTQSTTSFRILDAITLANGSSVVVTAQAEEAGLGGNVAVNTIASLLTPYPGISINNPGTANVWLTQIGTREESDESLRIRCKARWPGRGGGKTVLAYEGMALEIEQVRQARVFPSAPGDGKAIIVIAGDTNPLDNSVVLQAEALILPRASLCALVDVQAASAVNLSVVATAYVEAAYLATVAADLDTALRTLIANRRIGQGVYRSEIIEALMAVPGVGNVELGAPAVNVSINETEIISLLTAPTITIAPLP